MLRRSRHHQAQLGASPGEQNIDVQYWSSNAGDTTKIKDVRVLVIEADAADQYAESLAQTTTSTS